MFHISKVASLSLKPIPPFIQPVSMSESTFGPGYSSAPSLDLISLLQKPIYIRVSEIWCRIYAHNFWLSGVPCPTSIMAQHRDIRSKFQPNTDKGPPRYPTQSQLEHKFPPELIDTIISFLPTPDQVCFALSCKYIFDCLSTWLKRKHTSLRQLLPRLILSPNRLKRSREQLLTQLESERWEFCKCQILHPRICPITCGLTKEECEFKKVLICPKLYLRDFDPMGSITLDLCPCMTITARDSSHIYETWKAAVCSGRTHTGLEYYYNGALSHSAAGRVDRFLRHTCNREYLQHPLGNVRAHTALRYRAIDDHTDNLSIVNSLEITMTRQGGCPLFLEGEPYSVCVGLWLGWFFGAAGWSYKGYQDFHIISFKAHSYWDKAARYPRSFTLDFARDFEGYWSGF